MEQMHLDLHSKTLIAAFVALFGVLGLMAYASLTHAETNAPLTAALFGTTN